MTRNGVYVVVSHPSSQSPFPLLLLGFPPVMCFCFSVCRVVVAVALAVSVQLTSCSYKDDLSCMPLGCSFFLQDEGRVEERRKRREEVAGRGDKKHKYAEHDDR